MQREGSPEWSGSGPGARETRMSKPKLKTRAITEAEREILRDAVDASAIVEQALARINELEQYVDGLGPPFVPQMG